MTLMSRSSCGGGTWPRNCPRIYAERGGGGGGVRLGGVRGRGLDPAGAAGRAGPGGAGAAGCTCCRPGSMTRELPGLLDGRGDGGPARPGPRSSSPTWSRPSSAAWPRRVSPAAASPAAGCSGGVAARGGDRPVRPGGTPAGSSPRSPQPGLPVLPAYVPREHDEDLGRVVRAAAQGRSGIAVLVGGSSTGKTRACWEALGVLRDLPESWRVWHPIDPSRPDAALAELPGIEPRTVVWLNEAQFYLRRRRGAGWASGSRRGCGSCCAMRAGRRCWCWPRYGRSSGTS